MDGYRLLIALGGALAFAAVALLAFVAVRVEQAHREREREAGRRLPPREPEPERRVPSDPPCGGDLPHLMTAEDLPPFRARGEAKPRGWRDDEEGFNPLLRR